MTYESDDVIYEDDNVIVDNDNDDSCNSDWSVEAETEFDANTDLDWNSDNEYVPKYNGLFGIDEKGINSILQKTNRILSKNENITVISHPNDDIIGCANHKQSIIYLGYKKMKLIKTIDSFYKMMILVKGVNYHEREHLQLTDYSVDMIQRFLTNIYQQSKGTGNRIYISVSDYFPYLNLLEDCRIENLGTLVYPRMKYYFTFCAMNIIAQDFAEMFKKSSKSAIAQSYLVLYGRKFLYDDVYFRKALKDIRYKFYQEFPEDSLVISRGEAIVDEFIKTADTKTRLKIAYQLYNLFNKSNMSMKKERINGYSQMKAQKGSKSMNTELSLQIQIVIETANEKLNNEPDSDGNDVDKDKSDKSDKSKDCDKNCDITDGSNDSGSDSGSGSDLLSSNQVEDFKDMIKDAERQHRKGELTQEQADEKVKDLSEKLSKAVDEHKKAKNVAQIFDKLFKNLSEKVENNENIKKELMQEIVKLQDDAKEIKKGLHMGQELIITEKLKSESGKVEKVLRILRGDLHLRLNKYRTKGKVDISSVIKSRHNGTLRYFKNKQMNKVGKSKLAVSLVIDSSGSISDNDFLNEIEAVWCLSDALEKMDNHVEVIEFSSGFRILKSFDKKGDWKRTMSGNTYMTKPMEQSLINLSKMKKDKNIHNLFTIIISDGSNNEGHDVFKEYVSKLHKAGIKVLWIYASKDNTLEDTALKNSKAVDWFIEVPDVDDLSKNLQTIVIDVQKKINDNIGRVK